MDTNPKVKAIIFDMDGTLLDTIADITFAMNKSLAAMQLPTFTVDDYKGFVGSGLNVLVKQVLPKTHQNKKQIQELTDLFWKHYDICWADNTRPFAGILYLIKTCVSRKIKVAILSNKPHYFTKRMIRYYFRGNLINNSKNPFGVYSGEQEKKPAKPDPTVANELLERLKTKPEETMFIGDMDIDIMTAKNAGMIAVGATWGYGSKEELEKAGADIIYDNPIQLASLLDSKPNCL